ncbi:hypothetical protein KL944_001717 [Ogataea haglerorum]|nr:hypothetical protein KL944_001717 [Ogataea haglerorum]
MPTVRAIQRSISSLRNQGQMVGFDEENEAIVRLAVKVNTVTNFVLLASKDAIVFFTRSASTTASLVKSALGLLCTFVRVFFNKYASSQSAQFRNERTRLEPLGLLVLSMIIIILFVRVLQEAVNRLIWGLHEIMELNAMCIEKMTLAFRQKSFYFADAEHIQLLRKTPERTWFSTDFLYYSLLGAVVEHGWLTRSVDFPASVDDCPMVSDSFGSYQ